MAVEITMPQLSDTMNEGRILSWLKKEGDRVQRGDALAEVATDKADLEIESFHEGVLLQIQVPAGSTVKVGTVIAVVGETGESTSVAPSHQESPAQPSAPPPEVKPSAPAVSTEAIEKNGHSEDERLRISPLARNIAEAYQVDLSAVRGSGEGGRIVRRDVESTIGGRVDVEAVLASRQGSLPPIPPVPLTPMASAPAAIKPPPAEVPPTPPSPSGEQKIASTQPAGEPVSTVIEPLSRMRATIAQRMVESKTTIPHFYMTTAVRADDLTRVKDALKPLPQYEGLTYNHLLLKAVGLALRAVPRVNAVFQNGSLVQHREVNIGIVTAVSDGLLIPVLKRADHLSLGDVVSEAKALVQRSRVGRPKADDLMGGTFTVSNMGMFPVENFSAIINPGQGGILAVSAVGEEAVVEGGVLRPGRMMRMTLSVDHRIIDGVIAGEFLKELKRLLEEPILLLA